MLELNTSHLWQLGTTKFVDSKLCRQTTKGRFRYASLPSRAQRRITS